MGLYEFIRLSIFGIQVSCEDDGLKARTRNDRIQRKRAIVAVRTICIVLWMIATVLAASLTAAAQELQPLVSGTKVERTLVPGESHVYTITLQEGAALLGHPFAVWLLLDNQGTG